MENIRSGLLLVILFLTSLVTAQSEILRLEPPHWWTGMADKNLQIMVHGDKIGNHDVQMDYPGVQMIRVSKADSPNYLFIDLIISAEAKPGFMEFVFDDENGNSVSRDYELKLREEGSTLRKGFDQSDVIYLAMPDRFANGDLSNDEVPGMPDKLDRSDPNGRHGGDLQGILNHIPYLGKLGITALWLNPVLENNMPEYSYHGYAITDFYEVDARFGNNETYRELSEALHDKGIKLIKDMVFNHCGSRHWWMEDLPFNDWVHKFETFTRSNYRAETVMDPYAADYDRRIMLTGWFDKTMPDLNQNNPFLAKYLIQNSIWWIEEAGLDGIRMDTYPYAYADFMAKWMHRIKTEYPNFNVLGETWLQKEAHTAWFQDNAFPKRNDRTCLDFLTDFPGCYAINSAFKTTDSWTEGLAKLYYFLSKDYLYAQAENLILFADNHDLDRFFTTQDKDLDRWKMGMVFLMTTRGVPLIYYGTEYLDTGLKSNGDAQLRKDVPGGWPGDEVNVFSGTKLSGEQQEAFDYISKLISIRKQHPVLQTGQLTHFFPEDGIYLYFRHDESESLMMAFNNNNENRMVNTSRFAEFLSLIPEAKNLLSGETISIGDQIELPKKSAHIFKLQ